MPKPRVQHRGPYYRLFSARGHGIKPFLVRTLPGRKRGHERGSRHWLLVAVAIVGALLCLVQLLVLRASPDTAEGVGYLCTAGVHAALAIACLTMVRHVSPGVRMRWKLMLAACACGVLAYLVAAAGRLHFVTFAVSSPNMTWLFDTREALMLLAVLRVSRLKQQLVVLNIAQALLFTALRFSLTYWPGGMNLLANNHLIVTMVVSGFFVAMAWTASWGAVNEEEYWTLRMFTLLLACRFVQLLFTDAVAYLWMKQLHGSAWDVVGTASNLLLALYLIHRALSLRQPVRQVARTRPSLLVRGLMPSFLALGNILLALLAGERSRWYTIAGVGAATFWYAVQAALVQRNAWQQSVQLHTRNRELERIASSDPLTGVGNRHALGLTFDQIRQSASPGAFCLILIDADCFKMANDHHGHAYGDEVLIRIASVLQAATPLHRGSQCYRLGGDEFAMLLLETDPAAMLRCAEQTRATIEKMALPAGDRHITVSMGVTRMALGPGADLASALAQADLALYEAKSLGRNRVQSYAARSLGEVPPELVAPCVPLQPALQPRRKLAQGSNLNSR